LVKSHINGLHNAQFTMSEVYILERSHTAAAYEALEEAESADGDEEDAACSRRAASFFATLTCLKLPIPSRPHLPIMALSCKKKKAAIEK